jgi:hypothetical protein
MDVGTTLIGIAILLMIIIPLVIINRKKKKLEAQFLQSFLFLGEKNNNRITIYDVWNKSAIGIDKINHKLFYLQRTAVEDFTIEIDLSSIQKSRVVSINLTMNGQSVTDKISLVLAYRDKNLTEKVLEFYNNETDDLNLNGEIQLADKWLKIINSDIADIKHV